MRPSTAARPGYSGHLDDQRPGDPALNATAATALPLDAYRSAVALDEPVAAVEPAAPADVPRLVAFVRDALVAEGGAERLARGGLRLEELPAREQVRALLTVRDPWPLPAAVLAALEQVLARERVDRGVVDAASLPRWPGRPLIALWQGDITRLRIDAIVNAANERMLGCLRPFHRCIDNAIHMAAGPRLRDDTARIVAIQGGLEPTGLAKATRAYALPSRFVLHTVGPIVHGPLTREHAALLASAYRSCLDLAASLPVRSVAFCAISTGVFGYPPAEAAQVAISTVDSWLAARPGALDVVVFDVFSDADRRIYEEALR